MKRKGYRVIPQMFDVRPVDETGKLNVEKIRQLERIVRISSGKSHKQALMQASQNHQPESESRLDQLLNRLDHRAQESSDNKLQIESKNSSVPVTNQLQVPKFSVSQWVLAKKVSLKLEMPVYIKSNYVPLSKRVVFDEVRERSYAVAAPKPSLGSEKYGIQIPVNSTRITKIEHRVGHDDVSAMANGAGVVKQEKAVGNESTKPIAMTSPSDELSFGSPTFYSNYAVDPVIDEQQEQKLKEFLSPKKEQPVLSRLNQPKVDKSTKTSKEVKQVAIKSTPVINTNSSDLNEKEKTAPEENKVDKVEERISFLSLIFKNYFRHTFSFGTSDSWTQNMAKPAVGFLLFLLFGAGAVGAGVMVSRGLQLKDSVMVKGQQAISYLVSAQEDLKKEDFAAAGEKLAGANKEFEKAQQQLDSIGGDLLDLCARFPYLSQVSSGKNVVDAGKKLTQAASNFNQVLSMFAELDNPLNSGGSDRSMLEILSSVNTQIGKSKELLIEANRDLELVQLEDIPEQQREKFAKVKEALPLLIRMTDGFEENYLVLLDILGQNGPRKYLFVFQNNQEMRATGGFIGSYGILDISDGHIKNLFIDGIYNPDGQLRQKVIPPKPIQKISAAWSTHDANWYPNFPTSAEKIAWFYEKTGGPTVDGIISVTPTVLQKMLEVTGPVEMPEYDTVVDSHNFVEKTQYEVEFDYDKEANRPKQFIADLAPVILDKVFATRDPENVSKLLKIITASFKEKHVLIYSYDSAIQEILSRQGWSGEVLQTGRDYLMVVNSNINGFKTDGVIDETIEHQAEIQPDGAIVDTVKVKRVHNGGETDYEWWNKVNCDYMRLYVPKGSQLIEVKGQTREFNQPPLDYEQLGFKKDPTVEAEENSMTIDEETGTRTYEEAGKTVFANWVYVSPKETVEIEYKYLLPFKVNFSKNEEKVDTYSLLAQKQSGSIGSRFHSQLRLGDGASMVWKYPEAVESNGSLIDYSTTLSEDSFIGVVLQGR